MNNPHLDPVAVSTTSSRHIQRVIEDLVAKCATQAAEIERLKSVASAWEQAAGAAGDQRNNLRELLGDVYDNLATNNPDPLTAKLMALADRIDYEKLWTRAGMDRRNMMPEQIDRLDAGVNLRRFADLLGSNTWRIYPPKPSISYRADTFEEVVAMVRRRNLLTTPSSVA